MIYEITNTLLIPKIITLARTVKNAPMDALPLMLIESIPNPRSKIVVDERNGDVAGFIFATVENIDGADCVFIQFCVVRPEFQKQGVTPNLLGYITEWTRELGIKRQYFMTQRSTKAFCRRYKFKFHSVMLTKEIKP